MNGSMVNMLKDALSSSFPSRMLSELAIGLLTARQAGWNERFWAASYVWRFDNAEGQHDGPLMECLEDILLGGLTVSRDRGSFLGTSRMLAQLYFKYGKTREASNHLLMLRELDDANAPSWVFNFSAKLQFKLDPTSAVAAPSVFVGLVDESARRSGGEYDTQAVAVTKEFVSSATDFFRLRSSDIGQIESFVKGMSPLAERLGGQVAGEWEALLLFYSQLKQLPTDRNRTSSSDVLDAENRMLVELLGTRSRKIQELQDDITSLQLKNQELEASLRDAVTDSDRQHREIVAQLREEIGVEGALSIVAGETIRVLVLGASQIPEKQIWGIAATFGLAKEQVVLHLDYDENKRIDLGSLKYNSPYQGILVGPIAHKVVGLGDHASVLQKLQREEGFPPVEEIRTHSGELKITKTSFREALQRMMNTIAANTPVREKD